MTKGGVVMDQHEKLWWASPIVFGPRIPDFLSRLVALSNLMRLFFERKPHARSWLAAA
jgi:hypothetical protein